MHSVIQRRIPQKACHLHASVIAQQDRQTTTPNCEKSAKKCCRLPSKDLLAGIGRIPAA
jgi:hypothetical protein